MFDTHPQRHRPKFLSRRDLVTGAALGLIRHGTAAGKTRARRGMSTVTLLGDSITAGLGLPADAALPAQLQAALARLNVQAKVRASGVSGDTSADGLARADFSVPDDTDLCVVELGANDLLQGIDPKVTTGNLQRIIQKLKARKIAIVLTGLKAPPAIGRSYAREYDALFPDLARREGVVLFPDLLGGVMSNPGLNQGDGIHPNAQGVRMIASHLAPVVARALGHEAGRA